MKYVQLFKTFKIYIKIRINFENFKLVRDRNREELNNCVKFYLINLSSDVIYIKIPTHFDDS